MIGKHLSKYEIKEFLGEGGMGKVYRAYDATLEREVAIKILFEELAKDGNNVERFRREARAAAGLIHPNVITIHEIGEEDGLHYFVMEFLQAQTLREILRKDGRLKADRASEIARQMCQALEAAHSKGLLHRDIKAENVMILPDGTAKVLDFGIARLTTSTALTQAGEILGTVEYMAPERILGEHVDERSDLYSIGVLLYEMVTGELPFTDSSPVAIVYKHLEEPPVPPGHINSLVPPALERLILMALSKDPDDRYPSAGAMLRDVVAFLEERKAAQRAKRAEEAEEGEAVQDRRRAPGEEGRRFETKWVGREEELTRMRALFDGLKGGRGCTVFLSGEAGIGKTRLAEELMAYARRKGALTLSGACLYREGTEPYLPFLDALSQYFRATQEEPSDEKRARVKAFIQDEIPEFAGLTLRLGTSFGFSHLQVPSEGAAGRILAKERLFEALSQLLILLAEDTPLVLLLDDVHWADSASLQLLHYCARNISDHPLMIVATFRPEDLGSSEEGKPHPLRETLARMNREGLYEMMELEGLSEEDSGKMMASLFRRAMFSPEFQASLHRETGGNPFFIIEVLGLLRDQGVLFEREGVWQERREVTETDIPDRVYDVVVRRIERLDDDQRELLQFAAVEGERFTSKALCNLLEMNKIQLLRTIGRLERIYRIIRSQGDGYTFSHPKIREVLYGEMPDELRSAYHLAFGEYLEREHAERPEAVIDELAVHFYRGEDFDKATGYLIRAGDKAAKLYAYRESCRYYEQALETLGKARSLENRDVLHKELLGKAGGSYRKLGEWEKALAKFGRLVEVSEQDGDLHAKADALHKAGVTYYSKRAFEPALSSYRESLKRFREIGDLKGQCTVLIDLGNVHIERGDWDPALTRYQKALDIAHRIGDRWEMADVYINLGVISNIRGQLDQAMSHYEKALSICEAIGDQQGSAKVCLNMGMAYADKEDWNRALTLYERCSEISDRIKDLSLTALAHLNRTEVYIALADLKAAKRSCLKALEMFRRLGDGLGTADAFKMLGMASTREGDWDAARSCFERSIALNEEFENPLGLGEAHREYGVMFKEKGESKEALAELEQSRGFFEQLDAQEDLKMVTHLISELKV